MSPVPPVLDPLREGPSSSTTLVKALQLPQPSVSRALTVLQREGRVVKLGATRGTRYALPREVPGAGSSWPVFQVDAAGRSREIGRLHSLMPRHFYFESDRAAMKGLCEGLPWFLADQRPAGFLGDALAAAHPGTLLPARVAEWSDDHHLAWCTHSGWDCPGDLILGSDAREQFRSPPSGRLAIAATDRATAYPDLAGQVLAGGQPRAQLGGAQPKFTAMVDHGGHVAQAIVKFSPPIDSPEGERWADLLMAEHLAHLHLNSRGVGAAHSRVFRYGGRIFLEVDRFDRVGAEGRRGVASLRSVQQGRGWGPEDDWSHAAARLAACGALPKNDAHQIRTIEALARLIGNTDLGFDNLTLFDHHDGRFALAPVYDMAPTVFAPGAAATYVPPEPGAHTAEVWSHARRIAEGYWERLAGEPRLSPPFRELCSAALAALRATPAAGAG